jgi:hypothetical protein
MTSAASSRTSRKTFLATVLFLTMLGLGLRFYRLSSQSLWTDEVSSIQIARAPLDEIYQRSLTESNSLPTYFLLLRAVLSDSKDQLEFRARFLSAMAGALSIPVFIGVVCFWRRHRGAALLAGLLLAVNPLHIWYSQETRAYSPMLFFGLLTLLCFELARSSRRHSALLWGLYVVFGLAAIVLHKTGVIFPVACGCWHGLELIRGRQRFNILMVHAPIASAAAVVSLLKSYPPTGGYNRIDSVLEIGYTFMTFAGGYSFGPSLTDIQSYGAQAAVSQHPIQVAVLLAVLLLATLTIGFNFRSLIVGRETSLLVLGIGTVVAYAIASGFPYNIRYALSALFAFLALVSAVLTTEVKPAWTRLSVASLVLVALWADAQWFYSPAYRKGDSRAVAQWLVRNEGRVKSWTVLPSYLGESVEWYLKSYPDVLSSALPPKGDRTTPFPPIPDVLILGRRHHLDQPDRLIANYQSAAREVQANRSFTGFELYVRVPHPTSSKQ